MNDQPDDPELEARIEAEIARAIGPGRGVLPPEILDELRMLLRIGLLYHPGARDILAHVGPAPSVDRSDKIATSGFKNRKKAGNGGAR